MRNLLVGNSNIHLHFAKEIANFYATVIACFGKLQVILDINGIQS